MKPTNPWRLHLCKAGHFHLVEGTKTPSWPLWSLREARTLFDTVIRPHSEGPAEIREIGVLLRKVRCLTAVPTRDARGRFAGRVVRLRALPLDFTTVAQSWAAFWRGEDRHVGYVSHELPGRSVFVPLRCDFVLRPGETDDMDVKQLAELPATPLRLAA